jgi:hypothetical protein
VRGSRFVTLLAVLALAAVTLIVLGVPTWGDAEVDDGDGSGSPAGGAGADEVAGDVRPARTPSRPVEAIPALAAAIDSSSTRSADTAAAWSYRRAAVADLDADAVPERLVVASDVFVTDDGEPLWDELHRWAVYVEEDDGARTLVYSAFAPPGGVSVAVAAPAETGRRGIVVIEQGPRRGRLLLAEYGGVGRVRLVDAAGEELDAWVERVAEEAD